MAACEKCGHEIIEVQGHDHSSVCDYWKYNDEMMGKKARRAKLDSDISQLVGTPFLVQFRWELNGGAVVRIPYIRTATDDAISNYHHFKFADWTLPEYIEKMQLNDDENPNKKIPARPEATMAEWWNKKVLEAKAAEAAANGVEPGTEPAEEKCGSCENCDCGSEDKE